MESERRIQDIVAAPRRPVSTKDALITELKRPKKLRIPKLKLPSKSLAKKTGAIILIIVAVQVLYPKNMTLPFSRLDGEASSFKKTSSVMKMADANSANLTFKLRAGDKTYELKPSEAGLKINTEKTAAEMADYRFKWRLVPFSIFSGIFQNKGYTYEADAQKLDEFCAKFEIENHLPAVNAEVKIDGDRVSVSDEKTGLIYPKDSIKSQLLGLKLKNNHEYRVMGQTEEAKRKKEQAKTVAAKAEEVIGSGLTLILNKEKIKPSKVDIASWLYFPEDPSNLELKVGFKDDAIGSYLDSVNAKVYVAPVDTKVTYVNGEESKRVEGRAGRGIDIEAAKEQIKNKFSNGDAKDIELPVIDIQPKVVADSKYSQDQAGLQAVIEDAIAAETGDFKVKVQELGSRGWSAGVRTNEKTTPASTYKLFVAWLVLQKIDSGSWSFSDGVLSGQNVSACLEDMIVNSDNDCSVAFGTMLGGWSAVHDAVRNGGYSNTDFVPTFKSTVQDQATFLTRLYRGESLTSDSTNRLLGLMKRQRFRDGVPAGTKTDVANKVGFLYGYLHDSAIVYSPSGDYVVVVYSDDSSWAAIADISRKIHLFLNGKY